MIIKFLFMLVIVPTLSLSEKSESLNSVQFPDDFLFGTASSAYQTEGAWNDDGKGEHIWDKFTHDRPDKIMDGSNGDITCDSYHKLDEDIALLKDLRVAVYRFSLSWTRILPTGFPNKVNKAGIDYYNKLINTLLENNITPMVTIFHWDLPQTLQLMGGFPNPLIVDWFEAYARIVFQNFGDRVKMWITFNEPKQICLYGYGTGIFAPGIESAGIADYICNHNLLLAHARAYHMYKREFKSVQNGSLGIVIECAWNEPASESKEDIAAAERQSQFEYGLYAHPIFSKEGDYPVIVKDIVANRSKEEGFPKSRLPTFTNEQIQYILGTSDYFGLNHYSSYFVADKPAEPIGDPSQAKDTRVDISQDSNWPGNPPFLSVPWGLRKILNWIKDNYQDPNIYITEIGFVDSELIHDVGKIDYHTNYLNNVLDAIYDDGVRVRSYIAWSFLDYFEWNSGYTRGFGLHHVNFSDPNRPRTPRDSARVYAEIIKNRRLPPIEYTRN